MRQEARIAVGQAKEDTHNKVPVQQMHIVATVDFCQNVQLPSHKKDQPGETYFFVPLNIFVLGVVYYNSEKEHLHAYIVEALYFQYLLLLVLLQSLLVGA